MCIYVKICAYMCHALFAPLALHVPFPICAMPYYVPCPMCVMTYMRHAVHAPRGPSGGFQGSALQPIFESALHAPTPVFSSALHTPTKEVLDTPSSS